MESLLNREVLQYAEWLTVQSGALDVSVSVMPMQFWHSQYLVLSQAPQKKRNTKSAGGTQLYGAESKCFGVPSNTPALSHVSPCTEAANKCTPMAACFPGITHPPYPPTHRTHDKVQRKYSTFQCRGLWESSRSPVTSTLVGVQIPSKNHMPFWQAGSQGRKVDHSSYIS